MRFGELTMTTKRSTRKLRKKSTPLKGNDLVPAVKIHCSVTKGYNLNMIDCVVCNACSAVKIVNIRPKYTST